MSNVNDQLYSLGRLASRTRFLFSKLAPTLPRRIRNSCVRFIFKQLPQDIFQGLKEKCTILNLDIQFNKGAQDK